MVSLRFVFHEVFLFAVVHVRATPAVGKTLRDAVDFLIFTCCWPPALLARGAEGYMCGKEEQSVFALRGGAAGRATGY